MALKMRWVDGKRVPAIRDVRRVRKVGGGPPVPSDLADLGLLFKKHGRELVEFLKSKGCVLEQHQVKVRFDVQAPTLGNLLTILFDRPQSQFSLSSSHHPFHAQFVNCMKNIGWESGDGFISWNVPKWRWRMPDGSFEHFWEWINKRLNSLDQFNGIELWIVCSIESMRSRPVPEKIRGSVLNFVGGRNPGRRIDARTRRMYELAGPRRSNPGIAAIIVDEENRASGRNITAQERIDAIAEMIPKVEKAFANGRKTRRLKEYLTDPQKLFMVYRCGNISHTVELGGDDDR